MDHIAVSKELLGFIEKSPSMFHTIDTIRGYLDAAGFEHLPETDSWDIAEGGKYYTVRNGSSIAAFKTGAAAAAAEHGYMFKMCASHSDSPTYKVKTVPELEGYGDYLRLNVEAYGGMIDSSWFDRPLTVAGRVLVRAKSAGEEKQSADITRAEAARGIESRLLYIDRDILLIPNVAIHFNREINSGYKYDRQVDLCPMFSAGALEKGGFERMIADELGVEIDDILGKDLYLVNRQKPCVWGVKDEFISAPRLDDLQCAFASLKAFFDAGSDAGNGAETDETYGGSVNVYCCFDNEEVGSNTKQGAMSTFLSDTLKRINAGLGKTEEEYNRALAGSFMVSCDNAHAVHPNHPEKTDVENRVFMNRGIAVKENAGQKYTTDAFSRALFSEICRTAGVPVQSFANRSNIAGGSTLGNLSNIQVSVNAVDIGMPQLAMHSAYETAGAIDTGYAISALKKYYESAIVIGDGAARIY